MAGNWQKINSKIAYKNPWFRVREDKVKRPDGTQGIYGVVERPHANFIVAVSKLYRNDIPLRFFKMSYLWNFRNYGLLRSDFNPPSPRMIDWWNPGRFSGSNSNQISLNFLGSCWQLFEIQILFFFAQMN